MKTNGKGQDYMTTSEVANVLRVSKCRVQQLLNDGILPRRFIGPILVFTKDEVEKALARPDRRFGPRKKIQKS